MSKRKKFENEANAVAKLQNNKIEVEKERKRITLPKVVGLKLWSAVDYLYSLYGYVWVRKQ